MFVCVCVCVCACVISRNIVSQYSEPYICQYVLDPGFDWVKGWWKIKNEPEVKIVFYEDLVEVCFDFLVVNQASSN